YRSSLIEARLQRDKTLAEETGRDWAEIAGGTLQFDRNAREVEALRALTPQEVLEFWKENLAPSAPNRAKLVVAVRPGAAAEPPPPPPPLAADAPPAVQMAPPLFELSTDKDLLRFKRSMQLFPCSVPSEPQDAFATAVATALAAEHDRA
ncbi:hypothetical protein T492DRAFT_876658, partial [Pavlovales sp. CCMP2436]